MVLVQGQGFPIGEHLSSASPAEVALADVAVPRARPGRPIQRSERISADKARDSESFREQLAHPGIELTTPNPPNMAQKTQGEWPPLRNRKRWQMARLIA